MRTCETKRSGRRRPCSSRIAEGLPSDSGAMRRKYFTGAKGSLFEVVAAMDLAHSIGMLDATLFTETQETASRVRAMLVGLLRKG